MYCLYIHIYIYIYIYISWDLSNTSVLLLVNKIYRTENKHLLGIDAVVNQVTLRTKEMIHMFVT